jgi:protein-L-isoaspartate(D-aspartate) O-methyltransferase
MTVRGDMDPEQRDRLRREMIERTIVARGVDDSRIIAAFDRVPRECFVPTAYAEYAYADMPLPLEAGQTISQPFVVAAMTEALRLEPGQRCLEVGTGSGYQTAILLELGAIVFSVEVSPEVAALGRSNLQQAGYDSTRLRLRRGDGYLGWPEYAPFDRIIVTAAPPSVPPALLEQLAVGGRLVIPVGPEDGVQQLECWVRKAPGNAASAFSRQVLFGVRFVPLVSEDGAPHE